MSETLPPDLSSGGATDPMATGGWCSLHPRVVVLWRFQMLGRALTAVAMSFGGALIAANAELIDGPWVAAVPAVVALISLAMVVFWPGVAYRRWRYRLADEALEIERGVVVHRRSAVPYRRVQQVDLTRGPIDRMLGLTAADLTTAAATTHGSVPGLAVDVAEHFRLLVLQRAGRDDAV